MELRAAVSSRAPQAAPTPAENYSPIPEMGSGERTLVGIGKGLTSVGQSVKQGYLHAFGSPEEAKAYDADLREEDKLFDPLRQQSTAASLGEIAGASAPGFLIPGGAPATLARRLGGYALQGAVLGATQPVLTKPAPAEAGGNFATEKLGQTAMGAGTGAAVGGAISGGAKVIGGLMPQNIVARTANALHGRAMGKPIGQEGERLAGATGMDLTPGMKAGTKPITLAENAARQSFFTADQVAAVDVKLGEQAISRVHQIMDRIKSKGGSEESVGNEVMGGIKKSFQEIRGMRDFYAGKDYGEVRKLAGDGKFFTFDKLIGEARAIADEYGHVAGADPQKIKSGVDHIVKSLMGRTEGTAAGKILGPNGQTLSPGVASVAAPVKVTIDQAMKQRSALSKATQGGINLFEDVQGAEQRRIAVRLLKAAEDDFAANGDAAGGGLKEAMTRANSRYRAFNQSLEFVEKSPLGRLLGEDLTNAAFDGTVVNTTAAEKFAQRFLTMKPSELKVSVSLLQAHAPDALQSVRRQVLEQALGKGMKLAPSSGISGPRVDPNKFINSLLPDENLRRIFDSRSVKEIGDVAGAMRRWADKSGYNFSGTAAQSEFLSFANSLLSGGVSAVAGVAGKTIGLKQIASAMENPRGRQALMTVLKAGGKTERAFTAAQILATETVLQAE